MFVIYFVMWLFIFVICSACHLFEFVNYVTNFFHLSLLVTFVSKTKKHKHKLSQDNQYPTFCTSISLSGLSLFWTGARQRGFTLQDVVRYLAEAPARQASLQHRKAALTVGHDADFVIWNPNETFKVRGERNGGVQEKIATLVKEFFWEVFK